jgi:hypothetical protein
MKHSHVVTLEKAYSSLVRGDVQGFLNLCSESMTFQIQGKSKLAGKMTRANFEKDYFAKIQELSGGTFRMELHDILASDLHATVLMTCKLTRAGKEHEYRSVHVWRWDADKPLAGYEYPRDLYQYDAIWA